MRADVKDRNDQGKKLLLDDDRVIFLSESTKKAQKNIMPVWVVILLVLAAISIVWRNSVKKPEGRAAALSQMEKRMEEEDRKAQEFIKKQREEYKKKYPDKHKGFGE